MVIPPKDGIYVKVAEGCYEKCPACEQRFWTGDGHKCDMQIFETGWWKELMKLFKTDPKTAKVIFDKRLPNPV